jgi:hypothetical protein
MLTIDDVGIARADSGRRRVAVLVDRQRIHAPFR